MKTVFLTGSTGFVGRAVVRSVLLSLQTDDRLYLLVKRPAAFEDARVEVVPGDLKDLEQVADIVRKADRIIHVAAEARLSGGHDYYGINLEPVRKLVEFAKEGNRLERFVFVSSIAAMDRSPSDRCKGPLTPASPCFPRTEYGRSKLLAEDAIVQSGLPYTIFRPAFVYGPGMRDDSHLRKFARYIRRGVPLHRLAFPGRISLIHVEDLAAAIVQCLDGASGRNRVYLAETESMPLGAALALVGESSLGRRSAQIPLPALKSFISRSHARLPVMVAGMFIDYFWMSDPAFDEILPNDYRKRTLQEAVGEITCDLL